MKKGISASKGYAIGYALVMPSDEITLNKNTNINPDNERLSLEKAINISREQIIEIRNKVCVNMGDEEACVFDSHLMLLDDPDFTGTAFYSIESEKISADIAINKVVDSYMSIFSDMEDEYLRERGADIKDVGQRILRNLRGKACNNLNNLGYDTIIVAHDLTPSDTAQLDKNRVIAFLTDIGGSTSHSAIMARTLEIPAVVGLDYITKMVKNGDRVIVDGIEGIVFINPDNVTVNIYEQKKKEFKLANDNLKKLLTLKTITKSGKLIKLAGNIGSPEDVIKVIENGGEGVGLFRTEFLYMNRDEFPGEDEQFNAYKYVAEMLGDKKLIIRTLDIGGDKKLNYLPLPFEMNPFLGYRAIRLCLGRKDIFKIQLRAILRASVYGNIQIIFPMISSLSEFFEAKKLLQECMHELKNEGKSYKEGIPTGIMVEIPSAAIMADEFAKHVDFFSIGTNDLIQYTLATDRMNENTAYIYNPMHPAVLRLIKMTIDSAHKEGKKCSMCGEMAADEYAIPILLEYGLDEFSMSASSLLRAKQVILNSL